MRILSFHHLFKWLPEFLLSTFQIYNSFCVVNFLCRFTPDHRICSSNYLSNFVDLFPTVDFFCGFIPDRQICTSDSKFVDFRLTIDFLCGFTPNRQIYSSDYLSNFTNFLLNFDFLCGFTPDCHICFWCWSRPNFADMRLFATEIKYDCGSIWWLTSHGFFWVLCLYVSYAWNYVFDNENQSTLWSISTWPKNLQHLPFMSSKPTSYS